MIIGQFGTFEVENYGDRLFPIIAEKELSQRIPEGNVHLYSPLEATQLPPIRPIISKAGIHFHESSLPDAILIGGGDIISFAIHIADFYDQEWKHPLSPHSACWALPSIFRKSGTPLVWNAPGVPIDFTEEQASLIKYLIAEVDYISVRDEQSLKRLRAAGVDAEITVVPDTAIILPQHFSKKSLEKTATCIFDRCGISLGESFVVQVHPYFIKDHIPDFVSTVLELKKRLARPVLLLPIGHCHNDHRILKTIEEVSQGEFQCIDNKLDLLSIAAVISHAGAFLGTSLHGNITAFAYGVPFLIFSCAQLTKLEGFANLIHESFRLCFNMNEILEKSVHLTEAPSKVTYEKLCDQVSIHFDRIARIFTSPSSHQENIPSRTLLEQYLTLLYQKEKMNYSLQMKEHEINLRNIQIAHKVNEIIRKDNEIIRKDEEIRLLKAEIQKPFILKLARKIKQIGKDVKQMMEGILDLLHN